MKLRIIAILLSIFILTFSVGVFAQDDVDIDELAEQADTAWREYDDELGYELYGQLVELEPDNPVYWYRYAVILSDWAGEYENALEALDSAMEAGPEESEVPKLYNSRGLNYFRLGDYENAITNYSQAIELDPEYELAITNRALAYAYQNDFESAYADIDAALALAPDEERITRANAEIQFNEAGTYLDAGDYERALELYEESVAVFPEEPNVHYYMGVAYSELGDSDASIEAFTRTLEINPDDADAYLNRGLEYSSIDDSLAARADFEQVVELVPDFADGYYYLGFEQALQGDTELAMDSFNQALEMNPEDPWYWEARAFVHNLNQDFEQSLADMDVAVERADGELYFTASRAIVRSYAGDAEGAAADLAIVDEANYLEEDPRIYNITAGIVAKANGDMATAAQYFMDYIDVIQVILNEMGPLTLGEPIEIDMLEGDVFSYTFPAEASTTYTISMTPAESNVMFFDSMFVILDPDGVPVAGTESNPDGTWQAIEYDFTPETSGEHTVLFTNGGVNGYGTVIGLVEEATSSTE